LEIIMTGGTTPQFEIPTDMRKMTERSLEQVKTAIDAYLQFFKSNVPDNVMVGPCSRLRTSCRPRRARASAPKSQEAAGAVAQAQAATAFT
jgi:hypothetical protein